MALLSPAPNAFASSNNANNFIIDMIPARSTKCLGDEQFVLEFAKMSEESHAVEVWTFPDDQDPKFETYQIAEDEIEAWSKAEPPMCNGQKPTAGLRLIEQQNKYEYPKFPMKEETFHHLLRKWEFPTLHLHWSAFYVGGTAIFIVKSEDSTKINFIIGGGIYPLSIGGIFSYDCRSNITTGCMVSGKKIRRWADAISATFLEVPNPMTMPIFIAEILENTAIRIRRRFFEQMHHIESNSGSGRGAVELSTINQISETLPDYRSLAVELSEAIRNLGLSQVLVERARLILEFALRQLDADQSNLLLPNSTHLRDTSLILTSRARFILSSLEHIRAEQQNLPLRLQSQNMVVANLVAQQDVTLSIGVARDSRELAAASRRDSSAMRIIALLGTVFLPGTFIATILALPLFKWDAQTTAGVFSTRLWVYFVIAIPFTIFTMAFMYFWLRRRERRDKEIAKHARTGRQDEGSKTNAELKNLLATDEEHGV